MASSEFLYETNDNYRSAVDSKIHENRVKGNLNRFENKELLIFLAGFSSGFYASLYNAICTYGRLSEKQYAAAIKGMKAEQEKTSKAEENRQNFLETVKGLDFIGVRVIKGGKAGATLEIAPSTRTGEPVGEVTKISAINLRKGDTARVYANKERTFFVFPDDCEWCRWDARSRDTYFIRAVY